MSKARQLTYAEKSEVADVLLNMIHYKHGSASAREWVDGVVSAIEVWREAKLDDPNFYWDDPKSAHNVNAALATAPPEQACVWSDWPGIFAETIRNIIETRCHPQSLKDARFNLESYSKQIGDTRPIKPDQPRAVSDGELNAEIKELLEAIVAGRGPFKKDNYDFACSVIENAKQNAKKVLAILAQDLGKCDRCLKIKNTVLVETGFAGEHELLCGQCVSEERAQADAVLAAHDQKVRAEVLEDAAQIALHYSDGWKPEPMNIWRAIRSLAAPAASKPEAGHE